MCLLWSFFLRGFPFPGPARISAVLVSAQSRTLTIRGDRKVREFSQAVILEDILENLKEHHVCSVQFLLGGEIRITFESSLDRDAVLCLGPLELKGVRCRFLEGGPPTTLVHVLYLPFERQMTLSGWLSHNTVRSRACPCSTFPGIRALPLALAWSVFCWSKTLPATCSSQERSAGFGLGANP